MSDDHSEGYLNLRMSSEMYSDVQDFRLAMENKIRSGTIHPDAVLFDNLIDRLKLTEKEISGAVKKELARTASPSIRVWQKEQKGIGEHLLGLLLGFIGDPYVAQPYHWEGTGKGRRVLVADEPYIRRVGQLWAYAGHGDPERKRRHGISKEEAAALGNPKAKKATYKLAKACVRSGILSFCDDGEKFKAIGSKTEEEKRTCARCGLVKKEHLQKALSDYGQLYLDTRHHYEDGLHVVECVRCGPSGKPAKVGTPLNPGHQEGAALRKLGKEILRDLWIAARADAVAS